MTKTVAQADHETTQVAPGQKSGEQARVPQPVHAPVAVAKSAAASDLPPSNGLPSGARAAGIIPQNHEAGGTSAPVRARMMNALQRTAGNARAGRMTMPVQMKLSVGSANDPHEREADKVAETVTQQKQEPAPTPAIQRQTNDKKQRASEERLAEKEEKPGQNVIPVFRVQAQSLAPSAVEEERNEQSLSSNGNIPQQTIKKASNSQTEPADAGRQDEPVDAGMEARIKSPGGGQPLPEGIRREMESGMGTDFSDVRVHSTAADQADAGRLNAKAFTHGQDIWLGSGASANDSKLMAHELTHTLQQRGNGGAEATGIRQVPATTNGARPTISQPGEVQEQEAEGVAQKMAVAASPTRKTEVPTINGSRPGALMLQPDKPAQTPKDTLPSPVQVNWGGDPFTISFERKTEQSVDYFYFVIQYTGKFPTSGPFVEKGIVRHGVMIGTATLNASVIPLVGQRVVVDLYGFRDNTVSLVDEVEYDDRSVTQGRRHDFISKSQGRFASSGSIWVRDPNAKPLEKVIAEPPPAAFASAGSPVFIGGISSVDVVLGPYNDQYRITVQSKATSLHPSSLIKAVLGITPLYRGQPVFGLGMEIEVKANPTIRILKAESGSITIDLDGDGKADMQIDDTISEPGSSEGGGPIEENRNHAIRVSGANIVARTFSFKIRYGSVLRGESPAEADKAATSNAFAVAELTGLKGKTGTFEEQFDSYEMAFMSIRKQAVDEHLISQKTYDAWSALSQDMTLLRPQIKANQQDADKNKVDSSLSLKAGNEATKLYEALADETKGRERTLPSLGYSAGPSYNPYTGQSHTYTLFKTFSSSGPGKSVAIDLLFSRWDQAFANYNALIGGLDRWIVDRLKETKGEENETVKRAEAIGAHREALGNIEKYKPIRIVAVFHPDKKFSDEEGFKESIPLSLYAWKEGDSWYLRDLSNPREPYTFPSVSTVPGEEPPVKLFSELDDPDHYPEGIIHFEVPGKYGGQTKTANRVTWKKFFTWLGIGLAVIGLAISAVATAGTTLALAGSVALAAGAIAGATAAGIDLVEGAQRGNLTTTRVVLDLASIVASIAGVQALRSGLIVREGLAAAEAGAPLMGQAAEYAAYMQKVYLVSRGTQLAADTVNLAVVSVETAGQLEDIEKSNASREEKDRAKLLLLTQLGILGGMQAMAIKGTLPELGGNRKLVLHFPDKSGPPVASVGGMEAPSGLKFSQRDVSALTGDMKMTIEELAESIKKGWQGPPIDVVELADGTKISLDNRRLLAAQMAGVKEIPVAYHPPNESFPSPRAEVNEFKLRSNIRRLEDGTLVVGGNKGEIVYKEGFRPKTYGEAVMVRTANQAKIRPGEKFPLGGSFEQPSIRKPRAVSTGKTPTQMGSDLGKSASKGAGGMDALANELNKLTLPQAQAAEAAEAALWGTGMRPAHPVSVGDNVVIPIAQEGTGQPVLVIKPDGTTMNAHADLSWDFSTGKMKVSSIKLK